MRTTSSPAHRVIARVALVVGLVLTLVGATSVSAWAWWRSSGLGRGDAATAVLSSPTGVRATSAVGSGAVVLGWSSTVSAASTSVVPLGYYVTRSGQPACGSDPADLLTDPTCTDVQLAAATYSYVVTAVYRSWTASTAPVLATVRRADQLIAFTTTPSGPVVGTTYTVAATGGGSGNPVVFASITPYTCTLTGSVVTFVAAGTCTLTADEAGNLLYNPAAQRIQTITVGRGSQVITFTSTAPTGAVVGGGYTVSATGGRSGNPVTFSSGTESVCRVVGALVTFIGAGNCDVIANQAGNANWVFAPATAQITRVAPAGQAITFTSTPSAAVVGGLYRLAATGGTSGQPVTFTSATPAVCSVYGTTAALIGAGTCTVRADQAGTSNYLAAATVTQSFVVGPGSQSVAFTTAPPASAAVGLTYLAGATATSRLTVALGSTTPLVCTVTATIVHFVAAGQCTLTADQPGNANYLAAATVFQSIMVGRGSQSVTITSVPSAPAVDGTYVLVATASSHLPVTVQTASVACSVAGMTVSFHAVGPCVLWVVQAGDADYRPSAAVSQSILISRGRQVVTFTSTPVTPTVQGHYTVTATGGASGNAVVFTSATTAVCRVTGSAVTFVGAGTCTLHGDQASSANYNAATTAVQSFTVVKRPQIVTITSTSSAPIVHTTYVVTATGGGSGLPLVVASTTPRVCAVLRSTVTFLTVGTCVVTVTQAGSVVWAAGIATQRITVLASAQVRFSGAPRGHVWSSGSKVSEIELMQYRRSVGVP